jgi:membrane-associated phospholipid phosphatase
VEEEHPRSGQPLLDGSARRRARAVLACCVVLVAVLGVLFAHQAPPAWIDRVVDDRVIAWLGGHGRLLSWLAYPATLLPAGGISAVIAIGCLVTRRLNGAVLAAAAIPVASAINDGLLKPLVHRGYADYLTYPSGHTASMFALAAMLTVLLLMPWQPAIPAVPRLVIMVGAWALGCVVAIAVIGLRWHYFTDTVAGAAVGTGTVCGLALILDLPVIGRRLTWGRPADQV